jgi:hypothetical protein
LDDALSGRSGAQPGRVASALATLRSRRSHAAGLAVLLALVLLPAPLLPPLSATRALESATGAGFSAAWLVATILLHLAIYGTLGVVTAVAIGAGATRLGRLLRLLLAPLALVAVVVVVRSVKLGHLPLLENAIVPIGASALGVWIGLLLRQHGWRATIVTTALLAAGMAWGWWPVASSELSCATEAKLKRLVESAPRLPSGDARFGSLLTTAFARPPTNAPTSSGTTTLPPEEENRAALLALGIAIGHERLARYAGLDPRGELVRAASSLRDATTLRGRKDWPRHFFVSAALAVVENEFVSDMGGLVKEELDALTHGTGFSFADLTADRAGARFARAATESDGAARAMQARVAHGCSVDDVFPPASDLPENLTVEEFRRDFGGVGTLRYRQRVADIEARLDRCAGLVVP